MTKQFNSLLMIMIDLSVLGSFFFMSMVRNWSCSIRVCCYNFLLRTISSLCCICCQKNEIGKKDFVRLVKGMVGEHLLKVAINRAVEEVGMLYYLLLE